MSIFGYLALTLALGTSVLLLWIATKQRRLISEYEETILGLGKESRQLIEELQPSITDIEELLQKTHEAQIREAARLAAAAMAGINVAADSKESFH